MAKISLKPAKTCLFYTCNITQVFTGSVQRQCLMCARHCFIIYTSTHSVTNYFTCLQIKVAILTLKFILQKSIRLYVWNYIMSNILCVCCVLLLSHAWLFAIRWTVVCQASLSMGFSRQEYWSGLPCPPPGDLPTRVSNLCLLHLLHCTFFTTEPPGKSK